MIRSFPVILFLLSAVATSSGAQLDSVPETTLRVEIPRELSLSARAQVAGAEFVAPVLVLEGVEIGESEGLTIEVLARVGSGDGRLHLGSAATVGRTTTKPVRLRKFTLLVPLNQASLALLADATELEITLTAPDSVGRPPLKMGRVYFQTSK
jgi:hypothetical protein